MMAHVPGTGHQFRSYIGAILFGTCLGLIFSGCATTPRVVPTPPPTFQEKLSWILRLEDQRVLRDSVSAVPVGASTALAPDARGTPKLPVPDLITLLDDAEPQLRRRAALAIGRVGLGEGVELLIDRLADPEVEVRQMSAFAQGLIGDPAATHALVQALQDPSPRVQGRAAQALGRIGAAVAAEPIGEMIRNHVTAAFDVDPEDLSYPQSDAVEAFRLGLYALADLNAFEPLARTILEENGQPILWWWPVAYALEQLEDPRAFNALTTLAGVQGSIGVALAARGLGALGDPAAIETLVALLNPGRRDARVMASAVGALAAIGDSRAAPALKRFVLTPDLDPTLLLKTVEALGHLRSRDATNVYVELITHPWAPLRAAALRALARSDPDLFVLVLSGLEPDQDWTVRAALAQALETVDPDVATYQLILMLTDKDKRVLPSVLSSLVFHRAPNVVSILLEHLGNEDVVVRKTAARLLGDIGRAGSDEALAEAYRVALADPSYVGRAAALNALATYGGPLSEETLRAALDDPDWAVRVLAVQRLDELEPGGDHGARIRPAPSRRRVDYTDSSLVMPRVSPHVYVETEHGTIEIELNVLDAPLTSDNFITLARRGFFDGLTFHRVVPNYVVQGGDPRSDSEGGPGYTVRDELSGIPYLRGTVGMALDWEDTGGSQFFITHSPQPHLDGRYTVFGRVVDGMEAVDQIRQGDVIKRVLVWDGVQPLRSSPR